MNKKAWAELLQYASPRSILIVNWKGKIMELHCPFLVQAIHDIGPYTKGEVVQVDLVKISTNLTMVFMIRSLPYYYYHFNILLE